MSDYFVEEILGWEGVKYYCICSLKDHKFVTIQYVLAKISFKDNDAKNGDFTYFHTIMAEKYKHKLYKKYNEIAAECKNNCRH